LYPTCPAGKPELTDPGERAFSAEMVLPCPEESELPVRFCIINPTRPGVKQFSKSRHKFVIFGHHSRKN
jgi:hypothetical protein